MFQVNSDGTKVPVGVYPYVKIYVATSFKCQKEFHEFREKLEANGHTISHDWTKEDASKVPEDERPAYLDRCARADLKGVYDADVVVLLAKPKMAGAFVELGYALGVGKPILVVGAKDKGNQDCIFYHLNVPVQLALFDTQDEAVNILTAADELAKKLTDAIMPNKPQGFVPGDN